MHLGHDASYVEGADVVVTSTAVKPDNPEVVTARQKKIPVVPRTPFRSDAKEDFAARLAAVVDQVNAELGLLPGPDLYAWFRAHPERLQDGLHPDGEGAREMIRLWAEAVAPLYPPEAQAQQ